MSTVLFSNSVADHGRVLALLEKEGLITLKEGVDKLNATTLDDIAENPKNLEFNTRLCSRYYYLKSIMKMREI